VPDEKADIEPKADPKVLLQSRKMELDAEGRRQEREEETKRLSLEAGWLGRFIGSSKNAPNNIVFLVVVLLIVSGIVVNFVYPNDRVEYWKLILPVLTLTLGYLFGKNSKD
jgi:hypothetical protein